MPPKCDIYPSSHLGLQAGTKICALEGMHPNNASTRCMDEKMLTRWFFLTNFDTTRSQWPSLLNANGPHTWKEESWPPLSMAPLSGKKNLSPGHWQGGGVVRCIEATTTEVCAAEFASNFAFQFVVTLYLWVVVMWNGTKWLNT